MSIKHAHLTMSLFDHQQDYQHSQINLHNHQLQQTTSIEWSIGFQSTSMMKHLIFEMIVQQSKVNVFEVVLMETERIVVE